MPPQNLREGRPSTLVQERKNPIIFALIWKRRSHSLLKVAMVMSLSVIITLLMALNALSFHHFHPTGNRPMRSGLSSSKSLSSSPPSIDTNKVKLCVQYCGGWGYERFYNSLKEDMEVRFPGQIEFEANKDNWTTGNFEVVLVDTQQVIFTENVVVVCSSGL